MSHSIIIGGGISGLTAAYYLHKAGHTFTILEATNFVGGRVQTDEKDGFLLDRGFQVLLTAYPEAKAILDYKALDLRSFSPGALILQPSGKQSRIGDPLRDLSSLIPTITSNAATLKDKLAILRLKKRLASLSVDDIFNQQEISTLEALKFYGFSDRIIQQFFDPFFTGIFLEPNLKASRRMFDFVFKMFGEGNAAVPNKGMNEIPKQIAASLPAESIKLKTKATAINGQFVNATGGDVYRGDQIIIATEATGLLADSEHKVPADFVSTSHVHYKVPSSPYNHPLISLIGKESRLVNNLTCISNIAPGYKGKNEEELLSITLKQPSSLSEAELDDAIKAEMQEWFGTAVQAWELLNVHQVNYALPLQHSVSQSEVVKPNYYTYIIGDHSSNGSLNEAMRSGRLAAEAITKP